MALLRKSVSKFVRSSAQPWLGNLLSRKVISLQAQQRLGLYVDIFLIYFQGEDNDNDKYHVAFSWVVVKLRDINDNKPQFEKANIETTVLEDANIGNTLETFRATDPDQGGKSKVSYSIDRSSDRKRQFFINENGTVSIQRSLDREETPRHQVSHCISSHVRLKKCVPLLCHKFRCNRA